MRIINTEDSKQRTDSDETDFIRHLNDKDKRTDPFVAQSQEFNLTDTKFTGSSAERSRFFSKKSEKQVNSLQDKRSELTSNSNS